MSLTQILSLTFFPFTSILCTRKSTPIVALASSSGSHCSSEKRSKRLLLPTLELPISRSLTLIADDLSVDLFAGGIVDGVKEVEGSIDGAAATNCAERA